ncbi:MAG TPA: hypothetical protein VLY85_00875 [Thermoplasmata archaeon]|nr:hypothetical protein [Thermoplasmata archaeon]
MRRGLVVAGAVVAVVGLLLVVASVAINGASTSQTIPAGSALTLTPNGVGSIGLSGSWSGGTSDTKVYLVTGTPACPSPTGVVASGSGASGSFSATLQSGTQYSVFACTPDGYQAVSFSYTSSGITYLVVIGIVVLVVGAILAVVGVRAKPKAAPVPETPPATPPA